MFSLPKFLRIYEAEPEMFRSGMRKTCSQSWFLPVCQPATLSIFILQIVSTSYTLDHHPSNSLNLIYIIYYSFNINPVVIRRLSSAMWMHSRMVGNEQDMFTILVFAGLSTSYTLDHHLSNSINLIYILYYNININPVVIRRLSSAIWMHFP